MKILIACEESQTVCKAFREKGHEAYSCDILDCSGGHPEWHIKGDVTPLLKDKWDMIIAHPPCTYLCVPGAHYLHKQCGRWDKMLKAREFFMMLYNLENISQLCIENPVPHRYAELPKYTQIINPWQFGHEAKKRTCLWLKGLPELKPTKIVGKGNHYIRKDGSVSNSKWYAKSNQKQRSKTFSGIAKAMSEQWG